MTDDNIRTNLVTKLFCRDCGRILHLSHDVPRTTEPTTGLPTGAAMVCTELAVYPCDCTKDAQKKLDTLRGIIREREGGGE